MGGLSGIFWTNAGKASQPLVDGHLILTREARRHLGALLQVTKPYQRAPHPDLNTDDFEFARDVLSQSPINGHLILTSTPTILNTQGTCCHKALLTGTSS